MSQPPIKFTIPGNIETVNATQVNLMTYDPSDDSYSDVTLYVVMTCGGARSDAGGSAGGGYVRRACFKTNGASLTQVGTTTNPDTDKEDDADWNAVIDEDGAGVIRGRVQGDTGQTVQWSGFLDIIVIRE